MSKKTSTKTRATPKSPRMSKTAARAEGAAKTERLRKAVIAEIGERLGKPASATKAKGKAKAKASPTATTSPAVAAETTAASPRRTSALDAAAAVLATESKPLRAKDLIERMTTRGLWTSPAGKTPEATLYAAMLREIGTKGPASRFRRVDKGLFARNAAG
ncbi:MAG: winged helix-turn-helix domain-containing protein [Phycisphaerae bacterium]|nr:winged helix-turn-helix domain-containing protein [Phycisphaerae bacterium]